MLNLPYKFFSQRHFVFQMKVHHIVEERRISETVKTNDYTVPIVLLILLLSFICCILKVLIQSNQLENSWNIYQCFSVNLGSKLVSSYVELKRDCAVIHCFHAQSHSLSARACASVHALVMFACICVCVCSFSCSCVCVCVCVCACEPTMTWQVR